MAWFPPAHLQMNSLINEKSFVRSLVPVKTWDFSLACKRPSSWAVKRRLQTSEHLGKKALQTHGCSQTPSCRTALHISLAHSRLVIYERAHRQMSQLQTRLSSDSARGPHHLHGISLPAWESRTRDTDTSSNGCWGFDCLFLFCRSFFLCWIKKAVFFLFFFFSFFLSLISWETDAVAYLLLSLWRVMKKWDRFMEWKVSCSEGVCL